MVPTDTHYSYYHHGLSFVIVIVYVSELNTFTKRKLKKLFITFFSYNQMVPKAEQSVAIRMYVDQHPDSKKSQTISKSGLANFVHADFGAYKRVKSAASYICIFYQIIFSIAHFSKL